MIGAASDFFHSRFPRNRRYKYYKNTAVVLNLLHTVFEFRWCHIVSHLKCTNNKKKEKDYIAIVIMLHFQLLFIIVICLWTYVLWTRRKFYVLMYKISGPWGWPIIGMGYKLRKREDILQVFYENGKKYGNLFFSWLGPYPFLVVADPQIAQDVLTSPHCIDKGFPYNAIEDGTGRGLFSLKNPEWSEHRKLLNPAFGHRVLLSFMPVFNAGSCELMKQFEKLTGEDEIDVTQILQIFTLQVATQTTMGKNIILESTKGTRNKSLLDYYHCVQDNMTEVSFTPWLSFKWIYWLLRDYASYVEAKREIRKFIRNLINEKLMNEEKKTNGLINDDKNIFINRAIDLLKRGYFEWQNVEDESNVIVFGAFETTANTIFYTLMLLSMFPAYQQKAFEEILSLFPESGDFEVSYADTQQMTYMDMILNEVMRVMAPVPLVARQTTHDVQLSNGVILPRGVQIVIDIFNMHRQESIWGNEAHIFNPENFLPSNLEGQHSYAYIPFTKGLRNCIGWRYALMSTKVVLAKLLRNYSFTTSFNFQDLHFVEDITIKLKKIPLLKIHKRVA